MGFVKTALAAGLCLFAMSNVVVANSEPLSLSSVLAGLSPCALSCFESTVPASGCNMTDIKCLCPSDALRFGTTACVQAKCTIREVLSAKNITSLLCNDPVRQDNSITPVLAIFIGFVGLAVLLRVLARVLTQAYFWWDDLFNLFAMGGCIAFTALSIHSVNWGLGKDVWLVDPEHITELIRSFFINMLFYTATRFLIRASIILFYVRVFPPSPTSKLHSILRWTMVFNVLYNLGFFFAVVFQCNPVNMYWTGWDGPKQCGDANLLAWLAATTGIAFDVWLLVIPFPQLLALNLHWKKKLMGGLMFSVGTCVMIVSVIRLKTINEFTRTHNPTMDTVAVTVWSVIELDVGVICPCLPSFRLLFRRMLPRILGSTESYELDTTEGGTADRISRMTGNQTIVTGGSKLRGRDRDIAMPSRGGKKNSHEESSDGTSLSGSITGLVVSKGVEVRRT